MKSFTKVQEFKKQESEYETMLQPAIQSGVHFGLLRLDTDGKPHGTITRIAHWIYVIFAHLILWVNPVRLLAVVFGDKTNSIKLLPLVSCGAFFTCIAYTSTLSSYAISKHFSELCQSLDTHVEKYGSLKKEKWTRKYIGLWFKMLYGATFLSLIIYFTLCFYYKQTLQVFWRPFDTNILWADIFVMTYFFFDILFTISINLILFLLSMILWYLFISEFSHLKEKLSKMVSNPELLKNNEMERLRQEYTSLLHCFNLYDSLFRHCWFGYSVVMIPVVCFWLYGMIRTDMTAGELGIITLFMSTILMALLNGAILGAALNLKAHSLLSVLHKVDLLKVDTLTVRSISLFTARLTGPSIGFSVYGLYTFDTENILRIFGTLVTYTVVMLQFPGAKPDNAGDLNIICPSNVTVI